MTVQQTEMRFVDVRSKIQIKGWPSQRDKPRYKPGESWDLF